MRLKNSHRWKHSLGLQILICWVLLSSSAWSVQARRGTQIRFDTRAQRLLEQRAGERPPWLASRFAIRAQQIRAERLRETVLLYEMVSRRLCLDFSPCAEAIRSSISQMTGYPVSFGRTTSGVPSCRARTPPSMSR